MTDKENDRLLELDEKWDSKIISTVEVQEYVDLLNKHLAELHEWINN